MKTDLKNLLDFLSEKIEGSLDVQYDWMSKKHGGQVVTIGTIPTGKKNNRKAAGIIMHFDEKGNFKELYIGAVKGRRRITHRTEVVD